MSSHPLTPPSTRRIRTRGVALVLVLSFLVIISGLIIAFFSMVTTEASSASAQSGAVSAKSLADSATSLVMAQIVDATTGRNPNTNEKGLKAAWSWASQPGMIRTYGAKSSNDPDAARMTAQYCYKLYSADAMRVTKTEFDSGNDLAGLNQNWASAPWSDVFTDLNQPQIASIDYEEAANKLPTPQENLVYPIIDPRAVFSKPGDNSPPHPYITNNQPGAEDRVPAGDKDKYKKHYVDGFQILTNDPNLPPVDSNLLLKASGQATPSASVPGPNPLPMPVKWLYVLQDGTLTIARVEGSDVVVGKAGDAKTTPTAKNPIKGRIAFWADDESCKVNINTASEGVYWDTPHISTEEDCGYFPTGLPVQGDPSNPQPPPVITPGLALCQPATGEYQRYAGHPFTTCLSPIFGRSDVLPVAPPNTPYDKTTSVTNGYPGFSPSFRLANAYYTLAPRTIASSTDAIGGSRSGVDDKFFVNLKKSKVPNRLYASIDELLFAGPTLGPGATPSLHRLPNAAPLGNGPFGGGSDKRPTVISQDMMQKAKFFITANSSAPEVTLFNTPRVSMWPINDASRVNPAIGVKMVPTQFDNLAQFCTTIGGSAAAGNTVPPFPFYFTRWNPHSDTLDFTTPYTPPGGQSDNYNQKLYNYLYSLMSLPVPGFGAPPFTSERKPGSLGGYGRDGAQILTEIYDYIRCTNLNDTTGTDTRVSFGGAARFKGTPYTPVSVINSFDTGVGLSVPGAAEVVPIQMLNDKFPEKSTHGFGRTDTLHSAYLQFYAAHFVAKGGRMDLMGVNLLMSFYSPMHGNMGYQPAQKYAVKFDKSLILTVGSGANEKVMEPYPTVFADQPAGAVLPNAINYIETSDARTWHGRSVGGAAGPTMSLASGLLGDTSDKKSLRDQGQDLSKNPLGNYPFWGYVKVPATPVTFPPTPVPVAFSIKNDVDLTVTIASAPNIPTDGGYEDKTTGAVIMQTLNLRFPKISNIPFPTDWVETALPAAGYGDKLPTPEKPCIFNYRSGNSSDTQPRFGGGGAAMKLIDSSDTILALEPAGPGDTLEGTAAANPPKNSMAGDVRMYASMYNPAVQFKNYSNRIYFRPHLLYQQVASVKKAHSMTTAVADNGTIYRGATFGSLVPVGGGSTGKPVYSRQPVVPSFVGDYVKRRDGGPGDWDTGMGLHKDGAYLNKPDEGDQNFVRKDRNPNEYRLPYVYKEDYFDVNGSYFSPNRQVPSSMMFGSLPTGVIGDGDGCYPWQTLLFHATPEDSNRPGLAPRFGDEPTKSIDHLIADLFWMPVVEPYAISQPFSTAGKINMNYLIEPFTYIQRNTAMRAILKSTRMMAIKLGDANSYKAGFGESAPPKQYFRRWDIDIDNTLKEFDERFYNPDPARRDIFRSATEISTINMVPYISYTDKRTTANSENKLAITDVPSTDVVSGANAVRDTMSTFWGNPNKGADMQSHMLTGTNVRNKPYVDIYGRLTTKSNAFTVHVRAQALRKAASTKPEYWVNGKDQVVAEYRGSSIIERYIDVNDADLRTYAATLVDGGTGGGNLSIDQFYKFRVVSTKRFAP